MADLESQRGRQNIVSTGRGGAGNLIRSPSRGIDPETTPGVERGREFVRDHSIDRVVASGRGGAGNIRSPSRDPKARIADEHEAELQDKLIAESRGRQENAPFSTGRGGAGNINRSKSRTRDESLGAGGSPAGSARTGRDGSVGPGVRVSGRGGFGNITEERERASLDEEKEDAKRQFEADIQAKHRAAEAGKIHSSGKGGAGNMTTKTLTPEDLAKMSLEEQQAHDKLHANGHDKVVHHGGRGGAGNYHLAPEAAAAGEGRGRDANKGGSGLFGSVMRSLSRAKSGDRAKD